jgi:DNA-directed RNA polymerase specialized sigma24 family protein
MLETNSYTSAFSENPALAYLLAHRGKYLAFLLEKLRNRELAEELLQNVATKVVERGPQLRSKRHVEAWLYRIVRNTLADYFRELTRSPLRLDNDPVKLQIAAPDPMPEPCPCVMKELTHLKPEYEDALRDVEVTGSSVQRYAAAMQITDNAASVRLHRARKSLLKRVIKACGSCAGAGCFECAC